MQKIDVNTIRNEFYKMQDLKFKDDENFEYYILDRDYIEKLEDFFGVMSKSTSYQIFVRNTLDENLDIYDRGGKFIGAFDGQELIAVAITDTSDKKDSLSSYLHLSPKESEKAITLDTVCVLPRYRGNALQKKMSIIVEYLYLNDGYEKMFMTVSPMNFHSLKNAFALNYIIVSIEDMYATEQKSAVTRYIMSVDIGKSLEEVPEQYSVLNTDILAQKNVIDIGFVGMKIVNIFSEQKFFVSYSKAYYV